MNNPLLFFCFVEVEISSKGSPYDQVIEFTDGTVNVIARPTEFQEAVYTEHMQSNLDFNKNHGRTFWAEYMTYPYLSIFSIMNEGFIFGWF
jgi:hypothetical protein